LMMRYMGAAVSAVIAAPVEEVWALVSDPVRHPEIAGTGEVQRVELVGGGPVGLGSVFESRQNMRGARYVTANRVVLWEPPRRFAWRVGIRGAAGTAQIYGFRLAPEAGGTRVENAMASIYAAPTFFPFSLLHEELGRREAGAMAPTLANIARALGAPPPTEYHERREAPQELGALMPSPLLQGAAVAGLGAALLALTLWRRQRT
jgi:uncharacterized protein YndB with AHSA1/START domain